MSQPPASPLSAPAPWDLVAPHYAAEVVPLFETYARTALATAGVRPGMHVVDVAAGPGTLSALAVGLGARVDALDFSPRMVAELRARVARDGLTGLGVTEGDGMSLPYADARFDAGFSMFGLMFFPDRARGFRELHRVLRPGATAVVSSWVPLDRVPVFAATMGALAELTTPPDAPPAPPRPMPLTDAATCRAEMSAAGFAEVAVQEVTGQGRYETTEILLDSLLRTNAPLALARAGLAERWPDIEARWREKVHARLGPGPIEVVMTALLTHGRR